MKKIAVIGSTGSIGVQTLNVIRRYPEKFKIVSLAAGNNTALFSEQVKEFRPKIATIAKIFDGIEELKNYSEISVGESAFNNAITEDADLVVISLVGFTGIIAVLNAIEKGKDIALANKESLVVGGELVMQKAREKGVKIVACGVSVGEKRLAGILRTDETRLQSLLILKRVAQRVFVGRSEVGFTVAAPLVERDFSSGNQFVATLAQKFRKRAFFLLGIAEIREF